MLRCLQGPRRSLASAVFVVPRSVLRVLLAELPVQLSLRSVPSVLV